MAFHVRDLMITILPESHHEMLIRCPYPTCDAGCTDPGGCTWCSGAASTQSREVLELRGDLQEALARLAMSDVGEPARVPRPDELEALESRLVAALDAVRIAKQRGLS